MKAFARIAMICAILPSMALAGGLFPGNPVPMTEGYGKDGAGTHFAQPSGMPGSDCVVNPVSFKWYTTTETKTTEVPTETLVPGDVISIPANVLFDFDKDFLRPEGKKALDEIAVKLKEAGVKELDVIGHTDSMGTDEYNMALGQRRADTVSAYLLTKEVAAAELIKPQSRGESEPVAPNTLENGRDNPQGRQLNRRVDLRVVKVDTLVAGVTVVNEEIQVTRPRNPQVFHVLASGNQVYCGADPVFQPNMLFWNNSWRNGSRW